MRAKIFGIMLAVLAGVGLLFLGQPSVSDKLEALQPQLDAVLKAREVQIDPAELIDLIYSFNTGLRIIDVRSEADFNLFHIVDAQHTTFEQIGDREWVKNLPKQTVIVLVSNDEKRATSAWKLLSAQGVENLYILEGGINYWLDLYGEDASGLEEGTQPMPQPDGDDSLRHKFDLALGGNHPASDIDPAHISKREYAKKVKPIGPAAKKTGSCG